MSQYDEKFYKGVHKFASETADVVVPIVLELCQPRSVVDVGCGLGSWLSVFIKQGIEDVLGIDGEWVDKAKLQIPENKFIVRNLSEPLKLDRQFDLAVSLEVAEHLPPDKAGMFVDTLVGLSPVVLFSAAVPHQGGADHRNEQWQSYWAKLFNDRGYVTVDCIRKRVWDDTRVGSCYAQNALFYVKESELSRFPKLKAAYETTPKGGLDMIHPDYLARVAKRFWRARQREKLVSVLMLPVTAVKWLFGKRGEKSQSGR